MIKPFDALYSEMEQALRQVAKGGSGPDRYLQGIRIVRDRIGKVQGPTLREIREKKKKEEENEAKALPNCYRNRLLHRSSFVIRLVFVLRI